MRHLTRVLVLFSLLSMATSALPWGAAGHQSSGAIADRLIAGTAAEKQVRKILGSNLMTATVWADCAKGVRKSNGTFRYLDTGQYAECAVFEKSPASRALMESYVRRNWSACSPAKGQDPCHKQYHYTDVSTFQEAYAQGLVGTSDHDIVGAIRAAIAVLRNEPAPPPFDFATKKEALRVLSHLVGDIHQPLHVGAVLTGLRKNMLTAAGQGLSGASAQQLSHANIWSERYLKHFAAYAQQDKMYKQYALLLSANKDNEKALGYYEKSAFDGDIILDKDAAYAAIVTNDQLIQKSSGPTRQALASKMARHSKIYAQMYPQDKHSMELLLRAADINIQEKNSQQVVDLLASLPPGSPLAEQQKAAAFKALAQADLKRFNDAETTILAAYSSKLTSAENTALADSLASIVLKQAEAAKSANNTSEAARHYARIATLLPQHDLAAKGLYQAASLSAEQGQWAQASGYGQEFAQRYPRHELMADVNRLLSSSYLKSNNQGKAAESLEALAKNEKDASVKAAALWQAANLYEQQNDKLAAVRALGQYVENYPKPFGQYMEALYKLAQLNASDNKARQAALDKIQQSANQAAFSDKTERTAFIAAWAQLQKANEQYSQFQRIRLVEPLAQNLALKKQALQNCVSLYTQAGANNQLDILAEASFQVASIYEDFAKALLASERPRNLRGDDLEQYNILLEDQAFPFEDKAIEFHQINLGRLKTADNPWLHKSLDALKRLTPARYGRSAKVSFYE